MRFTAKKRTVSEVDVCIWYLIWGRRGDMSKYKLCSWCWHFSHEHWNWKCISHFAFLWLNVMDGDSLWHFLFAKKSVNNSANKFLNFFYLDGDEDGLCAIPFCANNVQKLSPYSCSPVNIQRYQSWEKILHIVPCSPYSYIIFYLKMIASKKYSFLVKQQGLRWNESFSVLRSHRNCTLLNSKYTFHKERVKRSKCGEKYVCSHWTGYF